jgi:hypothetical protein
MDRTLVIAKPDAVERGLVGEIISRFERRGLRVVALEMRMIDEATAARHYEEHHGKPFYGDLMVFITRGPAVLMVVGTGGHLEGRAHDDGRYESTRCSARHHSWRPRDHLHGEPDPRLRRSGIRTTGDRDLLPGVVTSGRCERRREPFEGTR